MSQNDMLAQSLLAQLRQRPQQSSQARMAEQMMQQAGQARPIYNGGTGIAVQGLQGLLAGFMANRAETGDQEREERRLFQASNMQEKRDDRANSAFQAAMGGGAAPPMMQPQPDMGMQPPPMQPAVMREPLPPMPGEGGGMADSEARYASVPGRPALGSSFREPAWAAGLPPANGRMNPNLGGDPAGMTQTLASALAPMPQGQPQAMPGAPDANMLRQRIQALSALNDPRATRQMQIDLQELGRMEADRVRQEERGFRLADRAPEPLVTIQTPDGPRLVPRSAAVNQEPGRIDTQGAETFGSPVTEQGPDGRPIVVRYGNRGTRTVIAGAQPEAPRAGLNPTMGVDGAGNPVALLPRTDGTMTQPALPDGVTIMPRTREINTGTEILTVDQGGAVVARRPMDVAGRETQERIGQQAGSDIAAAPAAVRTADQSLAAVDGILNHPALRTATGLTSFTGGLPGTPMMDFRTRVDQLQGQAFLQAFESLRGGGAITQIEGEKATAAIARLNRSVSAADFRAALGEVRDVINAGRMRALARVPNSAPPGSAGNPAAPPGRLRFNPATGDFE